MDRTTAPGAVGGLYVDEDVESEIQGTLLVAADRNAIQEELIALIVAAGLTPSAGTLTQVRDAVAARISQIMTASEILTRLLTVDGTGSLLDADKLDGQEGAYYRDASHLNAGTIPSARLSASDLLTLIKTVDGSASGLDADLLDGREATQFANFDISNYTGNLDDLIGASAGVLIKKIGTGAVNCPSGAVVNGSFVLTNTHSATAGIQVFYEWATVPRIFTRQYNSGWGAWTNFNDAASITSGTIPAARMPALTGDVTMTAGTTTTAIAAGAVGNAELRDSAALSVIGRASNSSGDPADITAGTDGHVLRRSGTTLGFGLLSSSNVDTSIMTAESTQTTGGARTHTIGAMAVGEVKTVAIDLRNTSGGNATIAINLPAGGTYSFHFSIPVDTTSAVHNQGGTSHFYSSGPIAGGSTIVSNLIGNGYCISCYGTITRVS